MKIALATPNYWPYVRRGTARYLSNLSKYLVEKGHQVTIITAKPGKAEIVRKDGLVINYHSYHQHPLQLNYIDRYQVFAASAFRSFLTGDYDVIYCMHHPEGFAAHLVSKLRDVKYMFNITSVPFSKYWGDSPINKYMFKKSVYSANARLFPSEFAARHMQEKYGVAGEVIPMPVDEEFFAAQGRKDISNPVILFVSDLSDSRKGVHVLMEAFYLFKKKVKGAVLQLAGQGDQHTRKSISEGIPRDLKDSVHIIGQGRLDDLPGLYANASMTVLPSIDEVFGMVLIESLAAGTPVVGSNSGALPEIITSAETGCLFEPEAEGGIAMNATGLCDAMLEVYELARNKDNIGKCREHARRFAMPVIGERVERYLGSIARDGSTGSP